MLLTLAIGSQFIQECAFGGGMGAAYKSCDCAGIERLIYDRTEADGPRKTVCFGIIQSRECYSYLGGLPVNCENNSPVSINTGKQVYGVGENVDVVIRNNLNNPIWYYGFCSLSLCQYQNNQWYCEVKDCTSAILVIEAGRAMKMETPVMGQPGTRQRYQFEFQTIIGDAVYTIHSNEFNIQQYPPR